MTTPTLKGEKLVGYRYATKAELRRFARHRLILFAVVIATLTFLNLCEYAIKGRFSDHWYVTVLASIAALVLYGVPFYVATVRRKTELVAVFENEGVWFPFKDFAIWRDQRGRLHESFRSLDSKKNVPDLGTKYSPADGDVISTRAFNERESAMRDLLAKRVRMARRWLLGCVEFGIALTIFRQLLNIPVGAGIVTGVIGFDILVVYAYCWWKLREYQAGEVGVVYRDGSAMVFLPGSQKVIELNGVPASSFITWRPEKMLPAPDSVSGAIEPEVEVTA